MTSRVEQVCSIGGSRYLIASETIGSIPNDWLNKKLCFPQPATIIRIDSGQILTSSWLQKIIDEMLAADDVFCKEFLSLVLFQYPLQNGAPKIMDDSWHRLKEGSALCAGDLPPGPYLLTSSGFHKVFKLFPDPCGAFMYGVVESEDIRGRFAVFDPHKLPC
jgi:hypothetical protein